MADDPDILDPTFSRAYVGTAVMTALCYKLFDFDAKLNILHVLATGYGWADARTLLIRLRDGVQFHNGEQFDADAVKYSLERHLNASGSFRRSEIGAMDHVEVVDPLTVRIVMKQAISPFVAILTDRAGMMVPPKAAEGATRSSGAEPHRDRAVPWLLGRGLHSLRPGHLPHHSRQQHPAGESSGRFARPRSGSSFDAATCGGVNRGSARKRTVDKVELN
jgi:ABC-type transport system substrate-binding protein